MKKIKKIVLILLVTCQLICCFAGCNQEDTVVEEPFELTKEHLSNYTIIIPSQSDENMEPAASFVQNFFEQCVGIKPEIKTDDVEETEYEILVGPVNRTEIEAFYSNLEKNNYGYALVGKKILIAGNLVNMVKEAALLFKADVLEKIDAQSVLMTKDSKRIMLGNDSSAQTEEDVQSVLKGLTINALGDSYFEGHGLPVNQVWLGLLAKKYKISMQNYGKGGSTVTNYITTNNPMCERYSKMANNNPNIILVEGGRNDFNKGAPIGDIDSKDTKTFMGALNVIIEGLKEKYPNAMIVCISNWNFPDTKNGRTYLDYAKAMEAVAEKQGVYFIAAYDPKVSGIDMSSESFRAKYSQKTSDYSHLNAEGMKIAMAHFEVILEEYYTDFLSKK